jgi:hypothetical protein
MDKLTIVGCHDERTIAHMQNCLRFSANVRPEGRGSAQRLFENERWGGAVRGTDRLPN